jgi:hypothetical protein
MSPKFRHLICAAAVAASASVGRAAVVINEVDYDIAGNDTTGEFVELFNNGSSAVDLTGFSLVLFNGGAANDPSYASVPLTGSITAGGFYVIGNVTGANVDPTTNADLIQNGAGDAIGLYSSGSFPNGTAPTTTNLVAGVVYEGQDSFPAAFELITVDDNNADNTSPQRSPLGLGTGPFALATPPTPGLVNAVPEPTSLSLFTVGGLLLLRRRRA